MTISLPLNLSALVSDTVTSSECEGGQPPSPAATPAADLQSYFAERVAELFKAQQALREEFEAEIESQTDQTDQAGALRALGETAHKQAGEADTLLLIMARCHAPEHLVNVAEEIFDALREVEEQITDALAWHKGMGRLLLGLRSHRAAQR